MVAKYVYWLMVMMGVFYSHIAGGQSWPQFQQNAARQGRVESNIEAPYRVRWIWTGKDHVLQNKNSEAQWDDDLDSRPG